MLEAGLSSPGEVWLPVQGGLTEAVRTCWYDRAGVGRRAKTDLPRAVGALNGLSPQEVV